MRLGRFFRRIALCEDFGEQSCRENWVEIHSLKQCKVQFDTPLTKCNLKTSLVPRVRVTGDAHMTVTLDNPQPCSQAPFSFAEEQRGPWERGWLN